MTDEELAFIRSAAAEPADDTLRLVYADWLEEQGGEALAAQAAFVRLQVERSGRVPADDGWIKALEQETALQRKYQRDWNGRIHRYLSKRQFPEKVDARHGALRRWDYHRGMIARVSVTINTLTAHTDLVFALGPIAQVHIATFPGPAWNFDAVCEFASGLDQRRALTAVSVTGRSPWDPAPDLSQLAPFAPIPLLDLRAWGARVNPADLYSRSRAGTLSPVVLYHATRRIQTGSSLKDRDVPHVSDPFGRWNEIGPRYEDLIGEVLSPVPYQGTTE
jgi:uncharacterized protein (TIGR02996 family)